jgi:hypothetical protein
MTRAGTRNRDRAEWKFDVLIGELPWQIQGRPPNDK